MTDLIPAGMIGHLGGFSCYPHTAGSWPTEAESCAALDNLLDGTGMFRVYREVKGFYVTPRLDADNKTPRVDRVIHPTARAVSLGWNLGPVAIECKRSGEKIGRPISQALDYSRAVWNYIDDVWVYCRWAFLWPLDTQGGPVASIMAQNRVGGVTVHYEGDGLTFHDGSSALLDVRAGRVDVRKVRAASKVGSR